MYQALIIGHLISLVFIMWAAGYVFSKMTTRIHAYLFFNCVATLVNNTGYVLEMLSTNEDQYLFSLQMSYLGRVWIPFSLFVFVMSVCKIKIPNILMGIMAFAHAFTFFCVLTCRYQTLYYKTMTYVTENVFFPYIKCTHGIWYSLYTLIMIAYIVIGVMHIILVTHGELNPIAKKRLTFVTIAVVIESLGFLINMTGITGAYDCTVMGYSIGSVFMFIAIYKYKLLETLELAKDYIVDELSEAILSVNQFGQPEFYNKPAEELLKRRSLGVQDCLKEMEKAIEMNEPLRLDGRVYSPQVKPLYSDGVLHGKIYVLTDDTEHYKYMDDLKKQKDIAEKANASKSAFVSIVSHEIRTPMNAVVGMTDLLLKDREYFSDKQISYLKNIKNSGTSLVMIVNDILDQSKIEAGKMELIEDVYEIRPMVSDVQMIIENRVGNKSIDIICDVSEEVPEYLIGDGLRIRQILINLMNNSVKFTERGSITLKVMAVSDDGERKKIRFAIIDTGQGIKPKDLFKIGQAFTQVDVKHNYGKEGTGLGLSISKNFIELMGGHLEISSEYGVGSEFAFTISQGVATQIEIEDSVDLAKSKMEHGNDFTAPDAKILVVDDTEINILIIEELLASTHIIIDKATSGQNAFEKASDNRYDVIFMDYMMVDMDGVEVTRKIRALSSAQEDYYSTVPVIAMTADNSDETKEIFREAGVNDYIDKPVDIDILKGQLLKWISPDKIIRS